mmetsp:Transcript_20767/g.29609  ORF Transcript_20767/g.29609 Transcript_20767/m.29609 type:complete len:184 (+) Transcript_20767:354-905(+)
MYLIRTMELTEEQEKRSIINRERAFSIRRKRELEEIVQNATSARNDKKRATSRNSEDELVKEIQGSEGAKEDCTKDGVSDVLKDSEILESFEIGAAPMITKKEAMSIYCLPEGTLAVCQCVEKENPHRKGWSAMKLYHRSEIRRRARERHGGMDGLIAERKRREMKRCKATMEKAKDIFAKKS